jgi:hypothetical protein
MPLDAVVECIEFPRANESDQSSRGVISLRGQALPPCGCATLQLGGERPGARRYVHPTRSAGGPRGGSLFGESQTVIAAQPVLGELPGWVRHSRQRPGGADSRSDRLMRAALRHGCRARSCGVRHDDAGLDGPQRRVMGSEEAGGDERHVSN